MGALDVLAPGAGSRKMLAQGAWTSRSRLTGSPGRMPPTARATRRNSRRVGAAGSTYRGRCCHEHRIGAVESREGLLQVAGFGRVVHDAVGMGWMLQHKIMVIAVG